jgi:hypothetical protein
VGLEPFALYQTPVLGALLLVFPKSLSKRLSLRNRRCSQRAAYAALALVTIPDFSPGCFLHSFRFRV